MTIETGDSGFTGFGYGSRLDQDNQPRASADAQAGNGAEQSQSTQSQSIRRNEEPGAVPEEVTSKARFEQIPGLESSASDCLNRAAQIARSLNHVNLSSDHLMLALTLDQTARRLLERVGDVAQLREAAMQNLGRNHTKSSRDIGDQPLPPSSDLDDLAKAARQAAAEREQAIAISDLINAFPKANGRLTYGGGDNPGTEAVIGSIVPRVEDAVSRIEGAIVDAMQRQHQSVQSLLSDLSSRHDQDWQRKQSEFMDEIRRQVREAADVQFSAALKDLNDNFNRRLAEAKQAITPPSESVSERAPETKSQSEPETVSTTAEPPKSNWNWLGLLL
jgi:hypothetical protein